MKGGIKTSHLIKWITVEGIQVLSDVNSCIVGVFLNTGLVKRGEAETIEDLSQEHQNNENTFKGQGQE